MMTYQAKVRVDPCNHPSTSKQLVKSGTNQNSLEKTDPQQNIAPPIPTAPSEERSTRRRVHFHRNTRQVHVHDLFQNQSLTCCEQWYMEVYLLDFPIWVLTLIRFSQLLAVNISMHLLAVRRDVQEFVESTSYMTIFAALGIHFFFWLIEENTVYAFETRQLRMQLICIWITSIVYIACLTYAATFLYVYLSWSLFVSSGVVALSILYLAFHLHWVAATVNANATQRRTRPRREENYIRFNATIRPGIMTIDSKRPNLGRLVFPVPREYTTPGYENDLYEL